MGVRVRLKIRSKSGAEVESPALVNSGFETETSQLLLPVGAAKKLDLYPPPPEASIVELGTAGGPARLFLIREGLKVWVLAGDRSVGPVTADALISAVEEEILINDKLSEGLKLVLVAMGSGKWRFADDPPDKIRSSERPRYW